MLLFLTLVTDDREPGDGSEQQPPTREDQDEDNVSVVQSFLDHGSTLHNMAVKSPITHPAARMAKKPP
jgi:hypothetical protein